ncbi:MAG: carbohydrate-binding domain-containing protein [Bacteroidota bacterium]
MSVSKYGFSVVFILLILFLAGCSKAYLPDNDDTGEEEPTDYIWDTTSVVHIILNGSSISAIPDVVDIKGSKATITSAGTYSITGALANGQLIVDSDDDAPVRLLLNGASITCSSSAPLFVSDAEKVIIMLEEGTENFLTDGVTYSSAGEPNAALFSNTFMTIYGEGSLTVKGNYNDGISTDDGLLIKNGTISVIAADDGIRGKDYLIISGGNLNVSAKSDGLKSDNEEDAELGYIKITSGNITIASTGGDAIDAISSITVDGGTLNVTKCYEGLESAQIEVNDGNVSIVSTDDAFNATMGMATEMNDGSTISINGGNICLNASKGDGLDSNGNVTITAGTVIVHGPSSAPEVGFDINGTFNIEGGFFIATGPNSGHMIETPAASSGAYSIKATSSSTFSSSTLFHLEDASGNNLLTFRPVRNIYYLVFSSSSLKSGSSCSIYTGGTSTGTNINGLFTDGTYSGGTLKKTFTISSRITSVTF